MRREQRGITLAGIVISLAIAGVFIYCGMKVVPMYTEFGGVKESMEAVAAEPGIVNASKAKVLDLLDRRFNISYVDSVKKEHINLDPKTKMLTIKYEVRRELMYNLDIVGKFEHSVKLGTISG